ncbi:DUF4376 domain-containing protein [Methylobacterium ajmalii]|uniref:DUF4376 domain-containing protein n=1 Tax=Methylobacterium ajmalii TaxID=2738439 RepID=UPI002F357FF9
MIIYAIFAEDGSPRGFLPADVFGEREIDGEPNPRIPAEAVEITYAQWQELLSSNRKIWNGSAVVESAAGPTPDALLAHAKQRRWERENGGAQLGDDLIASDDRAKLLIMGARLRADADPSTTEDWDMPDGTTRILTAPEIVALSDAIGAHISNVFKVFSGVKAKIQAGQITTFEQVDAAFG